MSRKTKGKRNKLRKNPAAGGGGFLQPLELAGIAGNVAVTGALLGCTYQEKLLVAAFIPTIVKIIRTIPKAQVEETIIRLWPPLEDETPSGSPS